MSTTLLFLIPIAVLAVVWSVCFVGCTFPTSSIPPPSYTKVIYAEPSLIDYWWLNDPAGATLPSSFPPPPQGTTSLGEANDYVIGGRPGSYLIPPPYPVPPVKLSAPISGPAGLNLQQNSIVPGDVASGDTSTPASCAFAGGYVSIPWSTENPVTLNQFTLEAWIKPSWTGAGFYWVVFSAFINSTGFRLFINDSNQLAVVIGQGGTSNQTFFLTSAIDLTTITYVAVTCDTGGNVTLLASGVDDPPTQPQMFPATGYVPVDSTQPVTFFIGAGENDQPLRTLTTNPNGAPEFPFLGQMQSVALYSTALSTTDLQSHFSAGSPG
jgi:hypothetical protein